MHNNFIICEYIWIDNDNNIRSKTKNIPLDELLDNEEIKRFNIEARKIFISNPSNFIIENCNIKLFPLWNFDGSSTNQSTGDNTEVMLRPLKCYKHPFDNYNLIILCDCFSNYSSKLCNSITNSLEIIEKYNYKNYWVGLEQEYFIMDTVTKKPIGYDNNDNKDCQCNYYCGNDARYNYGRKIAELHNFSCLNIGIKVSGINAEVAVGQWEYQIGPVSPVDACHDLIVSRFILSRIAEKYDLYISFEPKVLKEWNGSGCHINISSGKMRDKNNINAYDEIINSIKLLKKNHSETIRSYGSNNELRMTGKHETSNIDIFTYGIGTRNTSVRIGNETHKNKYGYFEDRRPGANINPYIAISALINDMNN